MGVNKIVLVGDVVVCNLSYIGCISFFLIVLKYKINNLICILMVLDCIVFGLVI